MTRAGREPAEDIKRRLVAACQEVGFEIQHANMIREPSDGSRSILVGSIPDSWRFDTPVLSLMASVSAGGDWSRRVDVRCCATDGDPISGDVPWMKGRSAVPLEELIDQLQETLVERGQVIAAVKNGVQGPYEFERAVWKAVDLFGDMNLFGSAD